MIHTNDVENIINQLPEKDYYLYYHEDAWWVTNEWLCGTFAGRAFQSDTKEGAIQELIEYFNNHKGHESIVGRCVDDSGWPNVELVTRYVMKSYEEEPDLK